MKLSRLYSTLFIGLDSLSKSFINIKEFGGQLYIVRILMYYDYPLFFVCQNENDELYLFNETRDEDDLECWGVIKISHEDLTKFYNTMQNYMAAILPPPFQKTMHQNPMEVLP